MRYATNLVNVLGLCLLSGCAAGAQRSVAAPAAPAGPAPVPVLTTSLYSKDSSGALSEEQIQRVLGSAVDLQFPARVGVVPLADAFDPKGPVSIGTRSIAAKSFARSLQGNANFTHVSDVSTDLPNTGGIEGLRVLAARYRLRYLLLYSERFEDATHLNGWAWLYPTFVGMFIAPGVTVQSHGMAQADLLDVRTGSILFSVIQPIEVSGEELMIGASRAHREHQAEASQKAARELAKQVAVQTNALLAYADEATANRAQAKTRVMPPPISIATDSDAH
jgi:hypothetical protein